MAVKNLQQLTVPPFAPSANSSKLDQHILNDPSRITTIGDIIPKNSKIGETSHDFVESIPVSVKQDSSVPSDLPPHLDILEGVGIQKACYDSTPAKFRMLHADIEIFLKLR